MILVDTSAWVEFDRATRSPVDFTLTALITADGPIAVTEPIVMEVCAGARTPAREAQLRRLLTRFHLARFDAAADFDAAARAVAGAAVVAHLGDHAVLLGDPLEVARLPDRPHQRLLDIDVAAQLHRLDRRPRVGVVGGRDDHRPLGPEQSRTRK